MNQQDPNMTRRTILKTVAAAGAVGAATGLPTAVWAAGSDKPELEEVKIGFIPLTDCASVVMAWPLLLRLISTAMSFLGPAVPMCTP